MVLLAAEDQANVTAPATRSNDPGNGVLANGSLRVRGTQLVNHYGDPVQLRGFSTHGIHWFPEYANIRALLDIKSRGANLLRVAMYADSNKNGYNASSQDRRLNKLLLRMVVENSRAADLYTIIDWHLLEDESPLKKMNRAIEFFDEMSRIYADDPGIIYEICNEPNGDTTWDDIYHYAENVIPVIRKNAPEAIVIVGTPIWSSNILAVREKPLSYSNILYSYHLYTGTGKTDFAYVLDKARNAGLPVFVSEWGYSKPSGQSELNLKDGVAFLEYMSEHKLSWAYWSLGNLNRDNAVIKKDVNKLSGWGEEDLTVVGRIIFSALENGIP